MSFSERGKNAFLEKEMLFNLSDIGWPYTFVVQMKWKETLKTLSGLNLNLRSFNLEGSIP